MRAAVLAHEESAVGPCQDAARDMGIRGERRSVGQSRRHLPGSAGVFADEDARLGRVDVDAGHPPPVRVEGIDRVRGEIGTGVDRGDVGADDRQSLAGSAPGRSTVVAGPQGEIAVGVVLLERQQSHYRGWITLDRRAPGCRGAEATTCQLLPPS